MVIIFKEELSLEESLRKKIEFICDFTNNKCTIINGSIRKIDDIEELDLSKEKDDFER